MKSQFPEYYRVTRADLTKRFGELIFIFDASALLDIFRLDRTLTKEIFEVFERYSSQIAIPYHAAEEYNKRIHSVLQEQLRNIDNAQNAFDAFAKMLEAKRNQPYISTNSAQKLKALKNSIQRDFQEQRQYLLEQLLHGEFQNKMIDVLDGKVMSSFTKEDLQQIQEEGARRYEQKIPPGWKDNTKGENAYGDLINWKEILRYAKQQQKSIVFVTNDQKEDWICKYDGKIVCPHYELLREFYQEVGNNQLIFHIYTLDRFLDFVHEQDKDSISEGTIEQVRDLLNGNSIMFLTDSMSRLQESLAKISEASSKYREFVGGVPSMYFNSPLSSDEMSQLLHMDKSAEDVVVCADGNHQANEGEEDKLEDSSASHNDSTKDEPDES